MGQEALVKQLGDWRVLPRPDRFTELYFTHYRQLPTALAAGTAQRVAFTVHNVEHQTTTYHYQLLAAPVGNAAAQPLGGGTFTLTAGGTRAVDQAVIIPPLGARVAVTVELSYQGIASGRSAPSRQTQSIDYWVNVAMIQTGSRGEA